MSERSAERTMTLVGLLPRSTAQTFEASTRKLVLSHERFQPPTAQPLSMDSHPPGYPNPQDAKFANTKTFNIIGLEY